LVLTGYFHGMRNNTIIEPETVKKHEEQVGSYCDAHPDTTLMDAVKNVLGFNKWVYARSILKDRQGWGATDRGEYHQAAGASTQGRRLKALASLPLTLSVDAEV
jgi:hypothetical protein